MKICGLIVEYNPFHNGHVYHAQMAREKTQADLVIAVMSGNFLQRGEPAVVDKWKRASVAARYGVDLVIELPVVHAVQPADYFAQGAVTMLAQLGCDAICFGTDEVDDFDYEAYGHFYETNREKIEAMVREITFADWTYAKKMMHVLQQLNPDLCFDEAKPNHILALSYAKANAALKAPMALYPIARKQAQYHDQTIESEIASATAIRQALFEEQTIGQTVPPEMDTVLQEELISWERAYPFLRYRLMSTPILDLTKYYQINQGVAHLFVQAAVRALSFDQFLHQVTSKSYPITKIQRMCVYILLAMTTADYEQAVATSFFRPLAYTKEGQLYLKSLTKALPILAHFGKKEAKRYPLTLRADQLYQLLLKDPEQQNFGRFAALVESNGKSV
ncbi:nucleotidyltransferase [Enterococcus bulliens]